MKIRRPLAESRVVKGVVTSLFARGLRFIRLTNPPVDGSVKLADTYEAQTACKQPGDNPLRHPRLGERPADFHPEGLWSFDGLSLGRTPDDRLRCGLVVHYVYPEPFTSGSSSRCRWTTK